jgi:hypothetical protein
MRDVGLQVAPACQAGFYAAGEDCRHPGFGMPRGLSRALCIARGLSCVLPGAPGIPLHVHPMSWKV